MRKSVAYIEIKRFLSIYQYIRTNITINNFEVENSLLIWEVSERKIIYVFMSFPTQIYKFWDTGNMATIDSYIYIMIKYIGT